MHAHSLWSYDGRWPLDRLAWIYGRLGADAVMMSEHDTGFDPSQFRDYQAACSKASTASCTLVPGIEYSSPDNDIHILTWGLERFLGEHRPVIDTLQEVQALGGVSILAHPIRRRAWQKLEPEWFDLLNGIELWNRKADGISWGIEALALIQRSGLPAFVGHDFHRIRQIWPMYQGFERPIAMSIAMQDMERTLVSSIKQGKSTPIVFGRQLLGGESDPIPKLYPALERFRKSFRSLG
jgi:hypothetical protein